MKIIELLGKKINKLTITGISQRNGRDYIDCLCDCGKRKSIRKDALLNRGQLSCGCAIGNPLPDGEAAFNYILLRYKQNAAKRNLDFSLSKKEFKNLVLSNCHYCNAKPTNKVSRKDYRGLFIYNGVDRKDNSQGYTLNNSVTCCKQCNFLKKDYSYEEFINIVKTIYENIMKRNI